ncbi:HAD family hydrolase [Rickettsiales bacterium]|nr:HAD family hydrolase [Rickettsiales bacterium]
MPNKPKAILFDWDNTLADTWPIIHKSLEQTFIDMGKTPWTFEQTKDRVHKSLRDSFPEIFGDCWQEAGDKYLKYFEDIHLEKLIPLNGAKDTLDALLDSGIYLAVVSNKTGYNLRAEVSHLGWDKYFSKVIGAKDVDEDKPSPKPVHAALDGSGIVAGSDVWFIGDSLSDMQCAYNCGCIPVFYGDQDIKDPKFADYQPQHHAIDHAQLLKIIDEHLI